MEENIKKIREAAIRANDEIIKLEFGCRVRSGKSILVIVNQEGKEALYWNETDNHGGMNSGSTIYDEILGRPIRLADVLLAIGAKEGYLGITLIQKQLWNLKDDNLNHQSQETIDFIASLLTP